MQLDKVVQLGFADLIVGNLYANPGQKTFITPQPATSVDDPL